MKNIRRQILILTLLIIAASSTSFSQTQPSQIVGKNETVAFLIAENKNARGVIEAQEKHITDLEAQIAGEQEKSESLEKSYLSAKSEIESLRSSNEALRRAVKLNEQTLALLAEDNSKQKEKARKAEKKKYQAYLIAIGAIALKFLIP